MHICNHLFFDWYGEYCLPVKMQLPLTVLYLQFEAQTALPVPDEEQVVIKCYISSNLINYIIINSTVIIADQWPINAPQPSPIPTNIIGRHA